MGAAKTAPAPLKGEIYQMIYQIIPKLRADIISTQTIITVLTAFLIVIVSAFIGWILTKAMLSNNIKTNLTLNLILLGILSLALYFKYGVSITTVQGLLFFFVLLYASCSDITSHTMDDYLWVMVVMLGLCSVPTVGLPSMLIGAAMVFIPQILIATLNTNMSQGGADIKLSTAIAFLLGWQRGLLAFILGLLIAVVFMSVYRKIKNEERKQAFPLIPFLAIAAMGVFYL